MEAVRSRQQLTSRQTAVVFCSAWAAGLQPPTWCCCPIVLVPGRGFASIAYIQPCCLLLSFLLAVQMDLVAGGVPMVRFHYVI